MYGFYTPGSLHDSLGRAAMQPGGTVDGLSSLAQALLLDSKEKRERQLQIQMAGAQHDFQNRQLAQALQVAQMQNDTSRQNTKMHYDSQKEWMGQRTQEMAGAAKERADAAAAATKERANRDAMEVGLNGAKSIANGLYNIFGGSSSGGGKEKPPRDPQYRPEIYREEYSTDDQGHLIRKQVLKTPEELDQERDLFQRGLHGAVNGQGPAAPAKPPPDVLKARQDANMAARQQQVDAGVAQAPGMTTSPQELARRQKSNATARAGQIANGQASSVEFPDIKKGEYPRALTKDETLAYASWPDHWRKDFDAAVTSGDPQTASQALQRMNALIKQGQGAPPAAAPAQPQPMAGDGP
jgi:hypothetical protein